MTALDSALTIDDLKQLARRRVPKMFFEYADSGALTEGTYRRNEADFEKVLLRQRVATDISNRTTNAKMLGEDVAMPVGLAPTGMTGMQHADGEIHAARAAEKFGVPFILSTMSICSIEDVAAHTTRPFWFQLYVKKDRDFVLALIDRAKAAKCSALVLTVDLQVLAQRHKDVRNGLSAPPKFIPGHILQVMSRPRWVLKMLGTRRWNFGNIIGHVKGVHNLGSMAEWAGHQFDPTLNWNDVAWIKERWGGKLIIKGILDAEDARAAADTGADAIIVSNHGGRQLDGASSTIRILPDVVDAVGDRLEVYLDGGIRTGVDVMRALALGAKGTFIGRPFLYGLAAGGEKGVTRALDIIQRELDMTMGFCGVREIGAIGRHNIYKTDF